MNEVVEQSSNKDVKQARGSNEVEQAMLTQSVEQGCQTKTNKVEQYISGHKLCSCCPGNLKDLQNTRIRLGDSLKNTKRTQKQVCE